MTGRTWIGITLHSGFWTFVQVPFVLEVFATLATCAGVICVVHAWQLWRFVLLLAVAILSFPFSRLGCRSINIFVILSLLGSLGFLLLVILCFWVLLFAFLCLWFLFFRTLTVV